MPARKTLSLLKDDPQWYMDAVIYEIHVRACKDANGDGIGDFRGLTSQLKYFQELGVTALWLLPFYPSPLKDDGYDISNYTDINPAYGDLKDFKNFLAEAHHLGIRVITELVINHTSDQHPWFQRARRAPAGSSARDFYVWTEDTDKFSDTRIIFNDTETSNWTWDPVAGAYYWHRFYSHQPDLNFENPEVQKAVLQALDFWLSMGVDGLRLDAIPYLYEKEGTNCENLAETHTFLKKLRRRVDTKHKNKMLLAEANQWPEDAIEYFGNGDECHMSFHFPLMPRMFLAVNMEDRFPIIDILEQTPEPPEGCQWALFLRNHDELTLEMVTDEERDYAYRVYAADKRARINMGIRRRLAPLMGNNRRAIELLNGLLFSLKGTPVIYYGDEIGMGDNIFLGDRNGVRTPLQWSADRNAGFSGADPQSLYLPVIIDQEYHYMTVNVENQKANPNSLWWWMKGVIALRKECLALTRGELKMLHPENRKVLSFLRIYGDEVVLVVANLSRHVEFVDLQLQDYEGYVPKEMFGHTDFAPIGKHPYYVTLGPHSFYWFALQQPVKSKIRKEGELPQLRIVGKWESIFHERQKELVAAFRESLPQMRWFASKAKAIRSLEILDDLPLGTSDGTAHIIFLKVKYVRGEDEIYQLPLMFAKGSAGDKVMQESPRAVYMRIENGAPENSGLIYDASVNKAFTRALLEAMARDRKVKGQDGSLLASKVPTYKKRMADFLAKDPTSVSVKVCPAEQSNTSVLFGQEMVLKIIRKLEAGLSPEFEVGRYLSADGQNLSVPRTFGTIEYRNSSRQNFAIGIVQEFVRNEGNAWDLVVQSLRNVLAQAAATTNVVIDGHAIEDLSGSLLQYVYMLGERTGELHLAFAQKTSDPDFAPERFTELYQRSFYQSIRSEVSQSFSILKKAVIKLDPALIKTGESILSKAGTVKERLGFLLEKKLEGLRTRTHGDYHLGQVLFTGKDFVIIDFEGEPSRPLSERRLKKSPLRDVAGLLRSLDYASHFALSQAKDSFSEPELAVQWRKAWVKQASLRFLQGYYDKTADSGIFPKDAKARQNLLNVFLIEKAFYELRYELNNRPQWLHIPLQGLEDVLGVYD